MCNKERHLPCGWLATACRQRHAATQLGLLLVCRGGRHRDIATASRTQCHILVFTTERYTEVPPLLGRAPTNGVPAHLRRNLRQRLRAPTKSESRARRGRLPSRPPRLLQQPRRWSTNCRPPEVRHYVLASHMVHIALRYGGWVHVWPRSSGIFYADSSCARHGRHAQNPHPTAPKDRTYLEEGGETSSPSFPPQRCRLAP